MFALGGERITRDSMSELIRVERGDARYYVKRYTAAGRGLRRWLGRPRVEAEWLNLQRFQRWGVATAPLVAWGQQRRAGLFVRGALVTRELPGTEDLARLALRGDPRLDDPAWIARLSPRLAHATRKLHANGFAHNDLKWRNLLVNAEGAVFLIDCPAGAHWRGPFLQYRIVKDLACLDKVARLHLTRTQRLRFYLQYRDVRRLEARDKRQLRRVLKFFEGRA